MALLWFDGFDGQEIGPYAVTGSFQFNTTTRFTSGACLKGFSGLPFAKKAFTAASQVFAGAAMKSAESGLYISFYGDSGATQHITVVAALTNHRIEIRRGDAAGTLLASSANDVWADNGWFYLESAVTVADSGGTVEVRLNAGTTPVVSYTGDTKNGGTATTIDAVSWGAGNNTSFIDDVYVTDSTGSSPANTFLGDVRVVTVFPTGAGSSTGLTPSTGSNWAAVDDVPPSATDYSGSPTSGARDTYAAGDLPAGASTVYGARLVSYMHKSDAGAKSMKPAIKVGSTVYYGATQALAVSMTRYDDVFLTSPATSSAWTVSEINGAEIGAEVV